MPSSSNFDPTDPDDWVAAIVFAFIIAALIEVVDKYGPRVFAILALATFRACLCVLEWFLKLRYREVMACGHGFILTSVFFEWAVEEDALKTTILEACLDWAFGDTWPWALPRALMHRGPYASTTDWLACLHPYISLAVIVLGLLGGSKQRKAKRQLEATYKEMEMRSCWRRDTGIKREALGKQDPEWVKAVMATFGKSQSQLLGSDCLLQTAAFVLRLQHLILIRTSPYWLHLGSGLYYAIVTAVALMDWAWLDYLSLEFWVGNFEIPK